MPKIIQFLHTAVEATPNEVNDNFIPWNNHNDHRRKFILSNGKYVSGNNEIEENLSFWGEWEAQSNITRLKNTRKGFPTYLNTPFIDPRVPERTHNTDPYVFGRNFRYIVCKQGYSPILRNLEPFSLILFGSCIKNNFCLDTLFLVSNLLENYNSNNIDNIFNQKNQYYYASVNPLYDDTNFNINVDNEDTCRLEQGIDYSFYKGVNYADKDNYQGIYSFVPCKMYTPDREHAYIFKQPIIDLDIISDGQTQGINACNGRDFTIEEIVDYWKRIVNQVEEAKLLKGTHFKTPGLIL